MTYTDDLLGPDEDEKGQDLSQGCTGDPVTCPCESCQGFHIIFSKQTERASSMRATTRRNG